MALLKRAKEVRQRSQAMTDEYDVESFSASFAAKRWRNRSAICPPEPVVEKTSGVNDPRSTFTILSWYSSRLSCSYCLKRSVRALDRYEEAYG